MRCRCRTRRTRTCAGRSCTAAALSLAAAEAAARHGGTRLRGRAERRRRGPDRARARVLRRRRRSPLPGLRDAALRADLAAAGPARRPPALPLPARARRAAHARRRGRRAARSAAAARLRRVALAAAQSRRQARARRDDPQRSPSTATCAWSKSPSPASSRSAARCSTCSRPAAAQPIRIDLFDDEIESLRHVRRADAALLRQDRRAADPARARVPVRRSGDQGVPRALSRAFPGRPDALSGLSDDLRGAAARRASSTTCRCSSRRP